MTKFQWENLYIQPDLERVHRVGRMANQKPRDIVACFALFADRDVVCQNKKKLHLSNKIFINEDFCKNTVEVRKSQDEALREARSQVKFSYFSYRKLTVKDRSSTTAIRI